MALDPKLPIQVGLQFWIGFNLGVRAQEGLGRGTCEWIEAECHTN